MVQLNINMYHGINIVIDNGNSGDIVTFLDVYYIICKSIESQQFSISIDALTYVGGRSIPYDSNIEEWFGDRSHRINIMIESNPFPVPRIFNIYSNTNFSRYISSIRDAISNRINISRSNEDLLETVINDLAPIIGDQGVLRNMLLSNRILSGGSLGNDRFTVLLGTKRIERLNVAAFNAIPSEIYKKSNGEEDSEESICVICQTDFEDGEDMKVLRCDHHFHTDCIRTWLMEEHAECPLCRHRVTDDDDDVEGHTIDIREEVSNSVLFSDNAVTTADAALRMPRIYDSLMTSLGDSDPRSNLESIITGTDTSPTRGGVLMNRE